MALQQVFNFSENQLGSIIYIDDETGDYDAITNPGGYGSPNTERSDLALIFIPKYKSSTGDVSLTASSYDPESVEQLILNDLEGDGHYQVLIYSIPKKTGAETPTEDDFVYDFTGNQLQRWNGSSWVASVNADLETYDADHITRDYPHIPDLWIAYNYLNKLLISGCKSASRSDLQKYLIDTKVMKEGVLALFAEQSFSQAQENIEKYQSRVDTILALT